MSQKFVIIDGSSLVHRAFHALPMLRTADGLYTNAVYGFTTMLVKLLTEYKPDLVAVAFDKSRITFRTEAYQQYKGNRQATPGELSEQFPLVRELLQAFGITTLEEQGYEADDIIGTLSEKAAKTGYEVFIVTGDRDALQLIGPVTKVLLTRKGISEMEVIDVPALKEKYGLTPVQMIDMKGLMGDTSDNIPGVPGIGEKTALKLLAEFGSLENVLENTDKISGKKLQENIRQYTEQAILSKSLATIVRDMNIDFTPEIYGITPEKSKVRELFVKFEFKSLITRVDALFPENGEQETRSENITVIECFPPVIPANRSEVTAIYEEAKRLGKISCYPLASGHSPLAELVGLAITCADKTYFIAADSEGWDGIFDLLTDQHISLATYDAKKLYHICHTRGAVLQARIFDILIAAYLLEPTAATYPLDFLAKKYLGETRLLPTDDKHMKEKPEFACWASKVVGQLQAVIVSELADAGLDKLFEQIELPLVETLAAMEVTGIQVDRKCLKEMAVRIAAKIDQLIHEIYLLAGENFNVNSTKQLGVILFEKLKLPIIKKTKTGYSTDAEVLEKLAGQHPLIDKLLEYRMLTKLKSTYLDGLEVLIHPQTGRIHTSFNQMVTATGRLSSSEPNLQNIPVRSEMGRKIRELFVPGEGYQYLMSADYSQIELRILAHMAGDASLLEAFRHNQDIHTRTASEVFGVAMSAVTPELRSRAKAVNFGIVYGISDYGLSRDIGVSRKEAAHYIDSYFAKYQGVRRYIDDVVAGAHRDGYVTTLFGRRRQLPDINSSNFNQRSFAERTAMNTPIQGAAADIIKIAMNRVYSELTSKGLKSRLLLQVHDELVLEVTAGELDQVAELVKQAMEQAVELTVPLLAEVKVGHNWAEAK
ncbi:DNA polymerase I [Sporomusa acidovorans]|uniref:DNA polymerase I n=1 Tax=Sporomusa acidovorans (strain ATCC 49682 / DSM 3132 / Mol) TaxID=1123286 RepID=A0ABZ3J3Y8_SPOA4|nr:DNA polymerase I [Sporomusa acidovorans]OZC13385.1 DNA polymerase I [Sporomusa acidovorans DSM 3132]SDF78657.1 DNA polymerase I [Sporomusa acidovorans]